jgi:mycothiol synthase
VAALFHAAYGDKRPIDAEEVVAWCRNSELRPDWLRVLDQDGRIVGYGDIVVSGDTVAVELAAHDHWDVFLEWVEDEARTEGVSRVRVFFPAGHEPAAVLADRGYRLWRSAFTMQIDLGEEAPAAPALAPGIELREYEPAATDALRAALNEAFAEDPFFDEATPSNFREFYLGARGFDPSLWLLAWDRDELAGFVLGLSERAGQTGLGWIESLGVRQGWRRQGLGEALLRTAIARFHDRGLRKVGLGVDAENVTGALRLYERVGMRVVRRGDNWVREL